MSSHERELMAIVLRSRWLDDAQLYHCCLVTDMRAMDLKEGTWTGLCVSEQGSESLQFGVFGDTAASYADENGRVVLAAGEIYDPRDLASSVPEVARNDAVFCSQRGTANVPLPFGLITTSRAVCLRRQVVQVKLSITNFAQVADFRAQLEWDKWFAQMHRLHMRLPEVDFDATWRERLAVARDLEFSCGTWLPFQSEEIVGALQITAIGSGVAEMTAYFFTPPLNDTQLQRGCLLERSIQWIDEFDQQLRKIRVQIGVVL